MVWPIGQPNGPAHRTSLRSRELWLELLRESDMWSRQCGSLHVAYREDEYEVLAEFARMAPSLGFECELLSPAEVAARSSATRTEGLLGGLWSDTEVTVDPREVIGRMPTWLEQRYGVDLHFNTTIDRVAPRWVASADGTRWLADRIIVATGADFQTLYPTLFAEVGFRHCKLQMLRTLPQPKGWTLGPMLAGGLTLRHYAAFAVCKSLAALKKRIAAETPELDHYGIHVMAAQNGLGEVILGDSHEYGDDITPFDKSCIDELILRELRRMLTLPDWTIQERWHGIYAKAPADALQFAAEPEPNVSIRVAPGGCGMTMSFGLADAQWEAWYGPGQTNGAAVRDVDRSPATAEIST